MKKFAQGEDNKPGYRLGLVSTIGGGDAIPPRVFRSAEPLTLKGHTRDVYSVAFSPDGKRIVSGGDFTKVWDAQTGK